MALILDKSLTKEYVDISGVTGITYYNIDYSDKFGITHTDPYIVIDEISIDKKQNFSRIVVNVYHNKESRDTSKLNIEREVYVVTNEVFDIYFSTEILSSNNIFKQGYVYLKDKILTNWISDEI